MKPKHYLLIGALAALALAGSCSSQRKLAAIKRGNPAASLVLGKDVYVPEVKEAKVLRDTLRIKDDDGRELLLMKAIRDEETGDMVATETLDAAKITARFRNIAERHGQVDLSFAIIVPGAMQDSKWQLRFYPDMYMLGDVERLEPVIITGNAYRKAQLRGYQQYNRFLPDSGKDPREGAEAAIRALNAAVAPTQAQMRDLFPEAEQEGEGE
jgi:hypothetical protein